MKKKVLVCGAAGFIGRNIAETLAENPEYEVYGTYFRSKTFQHPRIQWLPANLTSSEDIRKILEGWGSSDILIQAAATTSGSRDIVNRPYIHVTDNAVMNSLIFREAFEKRLAQVLFFSCTVMYPTSETPLRETDFDANQEIFPRYFGVGWTKVYLEKMAEFFSRIGDTRFTVIRHSNIYGPHDKFDLERSHVFGATVTKVLKARDGKITVWGTGEEGRDLLYISDLCRFVELALTRQKDRYCLANVGYGSTVSIRDLVQKIIQASGQDIRIEYDTSQPTIPTKLCVDTRHAKELFGWEPQVTLEMGIETTIRGSSHDPGPYFEIRLPNGRGFLPRSENSDGGRKNRRTLPNGQNSKPSALVFRPGTPYRRCDAPFEVERFRFFFLSLSRHLPR